MSRYNQCKDCEFDNNGYCEPMNWDIEYDRDTSTCPVFFPSQKELDRRAKLKEEENELDLNRKITITREEYLHLRLAQLKLDLLDIGGVDNWEWYGDSLNPEDEPSFDEKVEKLKKEIFNADS